MNKNKLILEIWNNESILKYCRVVGGNNWEELRSELIGQLYKMKYNKLLNAYNNNFLEYMCFTIVSRIKGGHVVDTGMFYKHSSVFLETDADIVVETSPEEQDITKVYERILELVDEQHWYSKTLFKHYYIEGMKLKEISEKYGINMKSIHYAIGKVKSEIKKQIENDRDNYFD